MNLAVRGVNQYPPTENKTIRVVLITIIHAGLHWSEASVLIRASAEVTDAEACLFNNAVLDLGAMT
jgi:hypothetical protein